ncbi:uncharacterized protein LDX57_007444 [Aspergillus melleus]|uniref:uncharacterized protein n=1 Tax=Aspergillus melleus TaxID=138277 RepID=UPI001E8D8654|nr:uncharacterized protein LDX57_007444 [Aspergillus melleus]KAH8429772.1 hypothetical protein LDX57_007444 [Aspergillus melleus]
MGSVTYRDGLAILQLIAYLPSFFVAAFLVFRHGIRTSSGFIFLVIFTIVRVVGAACELATINNPSTGIYTAAAICSSIGLSPLLMTCSGLLSRVNLSMSSPAIHPRGFGLYRIVTIVALALTIAGLTSDMSVEGMEHPNARVKVGMILYVVCWVGLCVLLAILYLRRSSIGKGEDRALLAVAISAPLLLVRIIYAMLIFFLANSTFNALDGNNTASLLMSVLEEIGVVIVCLAIGFTLKVRREGKEEWKSVPPNDIA